jgi:hypothetical protein
MKQFEIEQQSNNSMNDMRRTQLWKISMWTNTAIQLTLELLSRGVVSIHEVE